MEKLNLTVLSTADFNAAVWTNKQYIASGVAALGANVLYIESLGLRRLGLSIADVVRVFRRFPGVPARPPATLPPSLRVVKPRVIPMHTLPSARRLNRYLLMNQIDRILSETQGRRVLWTFSPITYGIEEKFDAVVYHSVDLLHEIPGLPAETVLRAEERLLSRADAVIASSSQIREHLLRSGAQHVLLWENVADVDRLSSIEVSRGEAAVFAGNMTSTKVDFRLLEGVAKAGVPLHLAGPQQIDGTGEDPALKQLRKSRDVTFHGNLGLHDLGLLLNSATVGLIPYRVNSYTAGVFPMKVYEYLASGLAVVSTPLPSLVDRDVPVPEVSIASGEDFVRAVVGQCTVDPGKIALRRGAAAGQSWSSRINEVIALAVGVGR